jgi:hypothetical protein
MNETLGTTLVFILVFIVLFHRWRSMRAPTGDRYQRCLDCGKTRDIPTVGPPP